MKTYFITQNKEIQVKIKGGDGKYSLEDRVVDGVALADLFTVKGFKVAYVHEVGYENKKEHWHYLIQTDDDKLSHKKVCKLSPYAKVDSVTPNKPISYIFDYMRKDLSEGEELKGTPEEEFRQPLGQGHRSDYDQAMAMFDNGGTVAHVVRTLPHLGGNVGALEKLRSTLLFDKFAEVMRLELKENVTYVSGSAGCGKSRWILEEFGLRNVYRVTDYKHPFDGYQGQDVIVFEEFRNSLPFEQMLNYLDIYPCELPSRYANKVACFTHVFIVSNWSYFEQFAKIRENYPVDYSAWNRRVANIVEFSPTGVREFVRYHGDDHPVFQGSFNI